MSESFRENISGQRFGMLVAISFLEKRGTSSIWKCECDCGGWKNAAIGNLKQGRTRSCGCMKYVWIGQGRQRKHGLSETKEYRIWAGMRSRCSHEFYADYQGRGITVCDRWDNSFEAFLSDMGPCPSDKHSLDRIDNDGNYEPENCRWATSLVQNRNKRTNRLIEHEGVTKTLSAWAADSGMSDSRLWGRLARGWNFGDAITRPRCNTGPKSKS